MISKRKRKAEKQRNRYTLITRQQGDRRREKDRGEKEKETGERKRNR